MIAALLIVVLSASDAPLARRLDDGSVLFTPQGYANLTRETDALQVRVAELESSPRMSVPVLVVIVSTSLAVGLVVGWRLREQIR